VKCSFENLAEDSWISSRASERYREVNCSSLIWVF